MIRPIRLIEGSARRRPPRRVDRLGRASGAPLPACAGFGSRAAAHRRGVALRASQARLRLTRSPTSQGHVARPRYAVVMQTQIEDRPARPPILKRLLAGVVLVVAVALAIKLADRVRDGDLLDDRRRRGRDRDSLGAEDASSREAADGGHGPDRDHVLLRAGGRHRRPDQGQLVLRVVPDLGTDPVPRAADGDLLPVRRPGAAPPVPRLWPCREAVRRRLHALR